MKNSTIRCFIHNDINNNFIISSKRKIDNYTPVTLNYIKENFLMFDGNIKLRHLKFYNDTNLYGVKPLTSFDLQMSSTAVFDSNPSNEIAPEKISVTPTKLSTASETHGVKQLTSLNRNKDSKICLRNNNVKPSNEKPHTIDRIINKYY